MENGVIILGIIALLFLCMYGYAYGTVALEKIKERKQDAEYERILSVKKTQRLEKQKLREAKIAKLRKRSNEIRMELNRLEKVSFSSLTGNDLVDRMKETMSKEEKLAQTAS